MFASGAGGVHAWEASIETFNIYLMVSLLRKKDNCWKILTTVGRLSRRIHICTLWLLAKLALLMFYFRLSPQRWFKISVWSTAVFISGYTIGIFFAMMFACRPIAMNWDVTITEGKIYQQTWSMYRDRHNQHHQRRYPIYTTAANGSATPDALQAEGWFDGHLYYRIFDGRDIDHSGCTLARNA
ncbi:integral membrane [Fusarium agapanthi]|uniref:Integral membrane n=1 Tax=Fusarium agapanthi TaxID=1803897 RepID=A0A9P5E7C9_9HYPO|nr:integral membrane [Fusarium agapanthi]